MRKEDLKSGMIVTMGDGRKALVVMNDYSENILDIVRDDTFMPFSAYRSDLTCRERISTYGIEKIEVVTNNSFVAFRTSQIKSTMYNQGVLKTIWERTEEKTDMTIEEIEAKLGYSIKIVK